MGLTVSALILACFLPLINQQTLSADASTKRSAVDLENRRRELVEQLKSPDIRTNRMAGNELVKMGADAGPAFPLILDLLKKSDVNTPEGENIHEAAARPLLMIARDDEKAYDAVLEFIKSCPNGSCRFVFGEVSKGILPLREDLAEVLVKHLNHEDEMIRLVASGTLYTYTENARKSKQLDTLKPLEKFVPELIRALEIDDETQFICSITLITLSEHNEEIRKEVAASITTGRTPTARKVGIEILDAMDASVVPSLLAALSDKDETVRASARDAIASFEHHIQSINADDVTAIRAALCSDDDYVRETAAILLGNGYPGADWAIELARSLLDHPSPKVRKTCMQALERISPVTGIGTAALLKAATAPEPEVRKVALSSLIEIDRIDENALLARLALVQDPDPDIRKAARASYWMTREYVGTHGAAIPQLLTLLNDNDVSMRRLAVTVLGGLGTSSRPALDKLEEALADSDFELCKMAARTLARLGKDIPEVVPRLLKLLSDGDEKKIGMIPEALGQCTYALPTILPALIEILKTNANSFPRQLAANTLGKFGADAAASVPALIEAAASKDIKLSDSAIDSLGEIGPDAREAAGILHSVMTGPANVGLRRSAAEAMRKIGVHQDEVIDFFNTELDSSDPHATHGAALALGKIGPPAARAVPKLIEVMSKDPTRTQAIEALGQMGPAASTAIPRLLEILQDKKSHSRQAAASALVKIGADPSQVAPVLIQILRDDQERYPYFAAHALAQFGPRAASALPELRELRKSLRGDQLKGEVEKAIKSIEGKTAPEKLGTGSE